MNDEKSAKGIAARSPMTRRTALAGTATIALAAQPAEAAASAVAALTQRAAEKNAAFMHGDMARWFELARLAPDFTLMQPFGGPASNGFDGSPQRLAEMARFFRGGETALEVAQAYATDDLVVLVMIERQRAEVGGLPKQDWSLRVTEVFRRDDGDWRLVHRHADPLVRPITLQQSAMVARGALPGG